MEGEGGEPVTDGGTSADPDDAVAETAKKIDELSRRMSKKQSMHVQDYGNADVVEVDRTALEAILDVSQRIQDIQKKSKVSMSALALGHESYKDKQVNT